MPSTPPAIRRLRPDELSEAVTLDMTAFGYDPDPGWDRDLLPSLEPDRFIGAYDPGPGGEMVGVAGIFSKHLTFPGNRAAPVAGVTWVSVAPGRQGRGILRALMTEQLTGLYRDRAEPVAILTASESGIYGRFGYGDAVPRMRLEVPHGARFIPGTDLDEIREVKRERAFPLMTELYARIAPVTPGYLARSPQVWQSLYSDLPMERDGATGLRFALHEDGYASYRIKPDWGDRGPSGTLLVHEVCAATPRARASLWRHLLDYALTREILHRRSWPGEPLPDLLIDPRAARRTVSDHLWLRVIDLERAIGLRDFAVDGRILLTVADDLCPWNAGTWSLTIEGGSASVARTDGDPGGGAVGAGAPRVALGVASLAAAFLGGTAVRRLAAAGLVTGDQAGVDLLHDALATRELPHCPEGF